MGQFSLSDLTYVIRCSQQWMQPQCLHNLHSVASPSKPIYFGSSDTQVSAFCSLVPRPANVTLHDAFCCLYTVSFNFGFQKKPGNYVRTPVLVYICKATHALEMQTLNWIKLVLEGCVSVQYPVVGCDSVNMGTLMVKCSNINICPPPCLSTK